MPDAPRTITLLALESKNLDTVCYRGSAPIAELTRMSGADVFDQDLNPEATPTPSSRVRGLRSC
jgi:hypothetical protein